MSSHSPKPIGLWIGAGFGIILTFLPLWAEVFTKRQVDESEFYEEPPPAETEADSAQFSMTSSFSYTQTWIPTPLPLLGGCCALLFGIQIGKRCSVKEMPLEAKP